MNDNDNNYKKTIPLSSKLNITTNYLHTKTKFQNFSTIDLLLYQTKKDLLNQSFVQYDFPLRPIHKNVTKQF